MEFFCISVCLDPDRVYPGRDFYLRAYILLFDYIISIHRLVSVRNWPICCDFFTLYLPGKVSSKGVYNRLKYYVLRCVMVESGCDAIILHITSVCDFGLMEDLEIGTEEY